MPMLSRGARWMIVVLVVLFVGVMMADALGVFNDQPYTAVPHGSHNHYVPNECEDIVASDFPTVEPAPGERITCEGDVVPAE